jgi:UDP-2-acetamido-3-amino-2,3-dideoxy-glucuronate N-acetyltransferase
VNDIRRSHVAVVGVGAWGRNLARVFHQQDALRWICDPDAVRLAEAAGRLPGVRTAASLEEVLADRAVRAVAVATPSAAHYDVAMQALRAGRDVLVEKPLALTYEDGAALVREAEARAAVLMVGHVLQYHPAVLRLQQIVTSGELGKVYYLWSTRLNLGRVRREENILWSFAPHDISVMLLLLGRMPSAVGVFGGSYLQPGVADVTVSSYFFPGGAQGHIFVSWLHPFKEQRLVVVGSEKMAVFEDTARDKLRLYDKRITWVNGEPVPHERAETAIALPPVEPLAAECAHFLECVSRRDRPRTDGAEGLRVLRVLEASQRSLEEGRVVRLQDEESVRYA